MTESRGRSAWRVIALTGVAAIALSLVPADADAAIGQPSQLAPNDSSGASLKNLELGWAQVGGATSYDVQIADDDSFDGQVLSTSSPTTHFAVPVDLPRSTYVWRVRAETADGAGDWSGTATFTRGWDRSDAPGNPHLVTSNGSASSGAAVAVPAGETPAFTWDPLVDASFYEIEVSNKPFNAGAPIYSAGDGSLVCFTQHPWFVAYGVVAGGSSTPGDEGKCTMGTDSTPPVPDAAMDGKLHDGVTYYWRVRGRDGTKNPGTSPFADPSLSCTGVWTATGGTGTGTGGIVTVTIPSTPPSYLSKPECSQWTEGGSFTVNSVGSTSVATPPSALLAQPTAGDPAATQVAVTGTPLLGWSKVSGAFFYRIYLSRTRDITDSDFVYETQATTFTPVGSYADRSVPTYWTVQACGLSSCSSAAPVHTFTKLGRNLVKATGATAASGETTLSWSTQWTAGKPGSSPVPFDDQAASYQVQVAPDGDWTKATLDVTTDHLGNDPASTYLRVPTASLPGRYVWRVRATDETGRAWGWAYGAPYGRLATDSGFGLSSPLTVQFTEAVTGVAGGAGIKDAGGRVVAGSFAQRTATEWTFTPRSAWTAGQSYHLTLDGVTDRQGRNVRLLPGAARAALTVDAGSRQVTKVAGDFPWRVGSASDAKNKTFVRTSDRPSTKAKSQLSVRVKGTSISLWACKSPKSGMATVRVDGRTVGVVSLYRKYSGCRMVFTTKAKLANKVHTVTVVANGHKAKKSRGYDLTVDAVSVR